MTAQEARDLMSPRYQHKLDTLLKKLDEQIADEAKSNKDNTVFNVKVKNSIYFYKVLSDIKTWLSFNGFNFIVKTNNNVFSVYISWSK